MTNLAVSAFRRNIFILAAVALAGAGVSAQKGGDTAGVAKVRSP